MEKNNQTPESGSVNYDLKSEAVEKLLDAENGEAPSYSEEELNKYRSGNKFKIPNPVKIIFIKAWFAGAVCFFFLWGLGTYVTSLLDMLFILAVVLGVVTDLMVNSIIRFIEVYPGENDDWMLFGKKGMMSFFLNIVYSGVIIYCVYSLYNIINYAVMQITGNTDTVPLGVEPVLFGLFCMAFDMLFIGLKRVAKSILGDAKAAASSGQKQNDSST